MAEPQRFATALNLAYAAMAVVLTAITLTGYWYWGDKAHTLVTEDLDTNSPYARYRIGGFLGIHKAVEVIVILNVATTVPLLVLSLQDILHSFFSTEAQSGHPHSEWMVRLFPFFLNSFPINHCRHSIWVPCTTFRV
jgi:hypothetical protein